MINGEDALTANVIERAVDIHSLVVIASSGYQKCVSYLWRGWLVQDDAGEYSRFVPGAFRPTPETEPLHQSANGDTDVSCFVPYAEKINTSFWAHLDPDRMRVPQYQNVLHIAFSLIYLLLYTGAINTINPSGDLDAVETLLYIFTLGFICDEIAKLYKVGRYYLGFWNVFNSALYVLLTVSFITRMIALAHHAGHSQRHHFNELSYNFLAVTAPMFWMVSAYSPHPNIDIREEEIFLDIGVTMYTDLHCSASCSFWIPSASLAPCWWWLRS